MQVNDSTARGDPFFPLSNSTFRNFDQHAEEIVNFLKDPQSLNASLNLFEITRQAKDTFRFCKPYFIEKIFNNEIEVDEITLREAEIACTLLIINYLKNKDAVLQDFTAEQQAPNNFFLQNTFLFLFFNIYIKEKNCASYISFDFPLLEKHFIHLIKDLALEKFNFANYFKFLDRFAPYDHLAVLDLRLKISTELKLYFDFQANPIQTPSSRTNIQALSTLTTHPSSRPLPPKERFFLEQSFTNLYLAFKAWKVEIEKILPFAASTEHIALGFKTFNLCLEDLPIANPVFLAKIFAKEESFTKDEVFFCLDFAEFYESRFSKDFADALLSSSFRFNYLKVAVLIPFLNVGRVIERFTPLIENKADILQIKAKMRKLTKKWMPYYISPNFTEMMKSLFEGAPDPLEIMQKIAGWTAKVNKVTPLLLYENQILFSEETILQSLIKPSEIPRQGSSIIYNQDSILAFSTENVPFLLTDEKLFVRFSQNFYLKLFNSNKLVSQLSHDELMILAAHFRKSFFNDKFNFTEAIANLSSYRVIAALNPAALPIHKIDFSFKAVDLTLAINALSFKGNNELIYNIHFIEAVFNLTEQQVKSFAAHFYKQDYNGPMQEFIKFFPLKYFHQSSAPFIQLIYNFIYFHSLSKYELFDLIEGLSYLTPKSSLWHSHPLLRIFANLKDKPGQSLFLCRDDKNDVKHRFILNQNGTLLETKEKAFTLSSFWDKNTPVYWICHLPQASCKTLVLPFDLTPYEFKDLFSDNPPAYALPLLEALNFLFPQVGTANNFIRENWETFSLHEKNYSIRFLTYLALSKNPIKGLTPTLHQIRHWFENSISIINYANAYLKQITENKIEQWAEDDVKSISPSSSPSSIRKYKKAVPAIIQEIKNLVIYENEKESFFKVADDLFRFLDHHLFSATSLEYQFQLSENIAKKRLHLYPTRELLRNLLIFLKNQQAFSHYASFLVIAMAEYFNLSELPKLAQNASKFSVHLKQYFHSHAKSTYSEVDRNSLIGLLSYLDQRPLVFSNLDKNPELADMLIPSLFDVRIKEFRQYIQFAIQETPNPPTLEFYPLLFVSKLEHNYQIFMVEGTFKNGLLESLDALTPHLPNALHPFFNLHQSKHIFTKEQLQLLIAERKATPNFYLLNLKKPVLPPENQMKKYASEQTLTEKFLRQFGAFRKRKQDSSEESPPAKKKRLNNSTIEPIASTPSQEANTSLGPQGEKSRIPFVQKSAFWEEESLLAIKEFGLANTE